jgi:hypothetical protein
MNHLVARDYAPAIVSAIIPRNTLGVYILFKRIAGIVAPIYVGRSDSCLRQRLRTHNYRDRATHFAFSSSPDVEGAFHDECSLYHTYADEEEAGLLNEIHPPIPRHTGLKCRICSLAEGDYRELERAINASSN